MKEKKHSYGQKELALFQAVTELIEEGADIYTIKVSDITTKAGIGKGTAYEYFSSKEEMVSKAIAWAGQRHFEKISVMLERKESLESQILGFLDYIDEEMVGNRWNEHLLRMLNHTCDVGMRVQQEFSKCGNPEKRIKTILQIMIDKGKEEGSIHPELDDVYIEMILAPGLRSYFMLRMGLGIVNVNKIDYQQMKAFLCRNMLQTLSLPVPEI